MTQVRVKAAVAITCVLLGVAVPAAADTVEVAAVGLTFQPPDVIIIVGDSVHWTGLFGGFHTVAEVDDALAFFWNGGFHSPAAASEFTFTFIAPGLYHYICEPHVLAGMRGTVTVNLCLGDDASGDTDADGICDDIDICPGGDDNVDTDGDGVPDFCDPCPADNPDDTDGDGVCDSEDICPNHSDPDQADCDDDGSGDVCTIAECAGEPACSDCNENGIPDACDIAEGAADQDGNGIPDECKGPICGDCPTDVDGNGQTEALDLANLLGGWGPVTPGSACLDADGNGFIEAFDLAVLLGSWGPCE